MIERDESYITFQFEKETFYIEMNQEHIAVREIIITGQEVHLSSREPCLVEGTIYPEQIDAEISFINKEEFDKVWNRYMKDYREEFVRQKAQYPVGTELKGKIMCFYPETVLAECADVIISANYMECRRNNRKKDFRTGTVISGTVSGYDDENCWIEITGSRIYEKDEALFLQYARIMNHKEIAKGINTYYELWDKGLKKQANKVMKETMVQFGKLPEEEQLTIASGYCRYVCDELLPNQVKTFCSRIYHTLPYDAAQCFFKCIKPLADKGEMPYLRWVYEVFGQDIDLLERAYEHKECDTKTVQIYFDALLEIFYWGAHHFPEGCCISKEYYKDTLSKCERIVREHGEELKPGMRDDFVYWKKLYDVWYAFEKSDVRDLEVFYDMCKKENIRFRAPASFYYEK